MYTLYYNLKFNIKHVFFLKLKSTYRYLKFGWNNYSLDKVVTIERLLISELIDFVHKGKEVNPKWEALGREKPFKRILYLYDYFIKSNHEKKLEYLEKQIHNTKKINEKEALVTEYTILRNDVRSKLEELIQLKDHMWME